MENLLPWNVPWACLTTEEKNAFRCSGPVLESIWEALRRVGIGFHGLGAAMAAIEQNGGAA